MNEFVWLVRVYYEDTDYGGVVYYANYLKFMERARTEWLRHLGFEQDDLLQEYGIIFAVRQVELGYHRPARFNELLEVGAQIVHRGKASLTFNQEIRRQQDKTLLCSGRIKLACVERETMRPTQMPRKLLQEIRDVE